MEATNTLERESFIRNLSNLYQGNCNDNLDKKKLINEINLLLTLYEKQLAMKLSKKMVDANMSIWSVQFVTELERKQVEHLYNLDDERYPPKIKGYIDEILRSWDGKGARYLREKYGSRELPEKVLNQSIYNILEDRELSLSDRITNYMGAYREGFLEGYKE
ncbi:hypothetical protein ACFCYN_04565 [Gottfriedia sp. NPDC056225]|uniref:hypothetical protein n=1 Tax=Gottfriedia sp. NPDC056225 TaxID=3345751 RepID=UPI0035DC9EE4